MVAFPGTERKLRARISSYRSALNGEKKRFGGISDGGGKRYVLFALYFVLNDLEKCESYFDWFKQEFPDDSGEPIQKLCWAISLHRMGKDKEARRMLADLMLSNLYMIPQIASENMQPYDMWHASDLAFIDYVEHVPVEVLDSIRQDEIEWMKTLYDSFEFRRIRKRHIEIYRELLHTRAVEARRPLVREAYSLLDSLVESVDP
ncbi:MAG TPA: hypothetical protein PLO37_23155 [Candidatus Hydrogenedentes bacterium]|nr:hypothetical protein [Candidatus Hydrogenedentota bacterium]HPG69758.1 hypothetical protein [Candidatus Hydrogenedentota bacterium]